MLLDAALNLLQSLPQILLQSLPLRGRLVPVADLSTALGHNN